MVDLILCKGICLQVDLYSVFCENYGFDGECLVIGLVGWLYECCICEVYVCGLVCDYCVLWSVQDVVKFGFWVKFLWELIWLVIEVNDVMVCEVLGKVGIVII